MNFDNIELAAAELRNEPWVTPVSMSADPAVRAYLIAVAPTRVYELIQIVKRQKAAHDNLVLEVAAEKQRADMLLEQAQHAAAAVQAEQQRYAALAQELAAVKAAIPAQTGMPQQGGAPDPEWPAGEQEAWRLGYAAAQQGGGELPQDERESFEAWGHTAPAAPWFVAPDPNERDGETYIRKIDAAAWAAWQARAAIAQRAASVPAQAE